MALRVTRECTEVLGIASSNLRVTRACTEVFGIASSSLRVTRVVIECLRSYYEPSLNRVVTDVLAISDGALGYTDSIPVIDPLIITDTVDVTINVIDIIDYLEITDAVYYPYVTSKSVIDTFTISDMIVVDIDYSSQEIISNLFIQQFVDLNNEIERAIVNNLTISDNISISTAQFAPKIIDNLIITDSIVVIAPKAYFIGHTLYITDTPGGIFQYNITIESEMDVLYIDPDELIIYQIMDKVERQYITERTRHQFLTIKQNVQVATIRTGATSKSVTSTLSISDEATVARSLVSSFTISDIIAVTQGQLTKTTFTIIDNVDITKEVNTQITDELSLKLTVKYIHIQTNIHRIYSPFIGTTNDPDAPTPPSLTEPLITTYTNVQLSWPLVTPSLTLTLDGPELGNQDQLNYTRIHRETRGGTLVIFADPDWPKREQFNLQFVGLSETESQEILDFLRDTLGQQIKLRDWEGNERTVITLTPDSPITREGYCKNTISLNFESAL